MELNELNDVWQNTNVLLAESKEISVKQIKNTIRGKSNDILSRLTNELRSGLLGGLFTLFYFAFIIINQYNDTLALIVSITGILLVVYIMLDVYNFYLQLIRFRPGIGNLSEAIQRKLEIIRAYFEKIKYLKTLYGVSVFVLGLIGYKIAFSDISALSIKDITVYIIIICITIFSIVLITKTKHNRYIAELEDCMTDLNNLEPAVIEKKPTIPFAQWLIIILLIGIFAISAFYVLSNL